MNENDRLIEEPSLFDQLSPTLYLSIGFEQVKKNKGKPGVDGVRIEDFETCLDEELSRLQQELQDWTYKPSPVRRVEIPKPGGKGVRLLGIPAVRDRVVQATMKRLLEPIFEPLFSPHRDGAIHPIPGVHPSGQLSAVQNRSQRFCRPGRSQHQAVQAAQQIVNSGKPYVVDIDLSKFFDRIHHDRLIARLGQSLSDNRILRLIGFRLRSGVMINGVVSPSKEGAVQGGPLSPLLSNIVLDELDQELEKRGLEFCLLCR